eukprot:CAMPEP_0117582764 /NCGR_PEP_ID=MMETSP0784-20121206/66617_1 /TAXON_ID=39447 /ORGANISM="" /LENGTH=127 /DNA_ID=CAMNT_0005383329 /DNA_START=723 /DNA_END=1104 /DNA_ORIENTATION=-
MRNPSAHGRISRQAVTATSPFPAIVSRYEDALRVPAGREHFRTEVYRQMDAKQTTVGIERDLWRQSRAWQAHRASSTLEVEVPWCQGEPQSRLLRFQHPLAREAPPLNHERRHVAEVVAKSKTSTLG